MIRLLTLCTLLVSLAIFGCGPSEEKQAAPTGQSTTEKVAEAPKPVGDNVQEKAPTVSEQAGEMAKQTGETVKDAAAETRDMAVTATEKAGEMATEAKEATVEAAKETAATVAETAQTAAVATTMAADKAVEAAKKAVSPDTIVLEASYGNVTFPHAQHLATFECATCHGEGTPGLFGLDKDKAHVLCKDCHKREGSGPTACTGCHKK